MSSVSYSATKATPFHQANYTRLHNVVNSNTQKINGNVEKMNDLMSDGLSKCDSTSPNWKQFQHLLNTTNQTVKNTADHAKKLQEMFKGDGVVDHLPEKTETEQLTTQFEQALNKFNYYQKEAASIERRHIAETKQRCMQHGGSGDGNHAQGYTQEQQQLLMNQTDIGELQQRESELLALEESIMDVNQIFKDLQIMVADQGEVLDRIEDNITETAVKVESGNTQLVQAVEKQKSSRKKKLFCFVIVAVVLIVLAIVIGVSFT